MGTSPPTRLDDDVYADAKSVAVTMSRSTAQQLSHWARIGREVEASGMSTAAVAAVLNGRADYDDLDEISQAAVRAAWDDRMDKARDDLDLVREFQVEGRTWVALDDVGRVVRHHPDGSTDILNEP
ncbi:ParD-like family protein [soil metagenome]